MSADETSFTEFVNGDPISQRRYGNLPPAVAYRTPAVKGEFEANYQQWLKARNPQPGAPFRAQHCGAAGQAACLRLPRRPNPPNAGANIHSAAGSGTGAAVAVTDTLSRNQYPLFL